MTAMLLSTTSAASAGTYPIVVAALNGLISATTPVNLTMNNPAVVDYTSGLGALWTFADTKGTTTADTSGNGNNGTLVNYSWKRMNCSGCLSFNGSNNYVSVNESATLEQTQQMTVSMWVSPNASSSTDPRMISKRYSWDLKMNGGGHFPQFSAGSKYMMLNYSLALGVWQHVVFTFSGGVVKGYVNGQPIAANANTFVAGDAIPLQMYGLYLGADSSVANFYSGSLDEVRIYNRALGDADVAALYSNTLH